MQPVCLKGLGDTLSRLETGWQGLFISSSAKLLHRANEFSLTMLLDLSLRATKVLDPLS
jgi:hypothetical protein